MIRPIRADDRPAVETLRANLEYADRKLLDAAIDGPFLGRIAVESGTVVGYAFGFPGRTTILSELVVAPACRRSGYGRALLDSIASATDGDEIVVTTPVENAAARRFYLDLGFNVDERIREFYADGSDALRLVRRE